MKIVLLAIMLATASNSVSAANVVVILADDAGVGFNRFTPTPNISALARAGTRFSHGYADAPECSPSRSALLTSHNSAEWDHAKNPAKPIPSSIPIWPRTIQSAGIPTAFIGKWHMVNITPFSAGFTSAPLWFAGGGSSYTFDGLLRREGNPAGNVPGHLTDAFAAEAVKWINKQSGQFFLYLAPNAVHRPDTPSYSELVRGLDRLVGAVRLAAPPDTLIVFASDNGCDTGKQPQCSNLPFSGGKTKLKEGGLRIPYSYTWPGQIQAGVNATPITLQDIGPTVLDALDVPIPSNLKGKSVLGPIDPNRPLVFGSKARGTIRVGDYKLNETGRLYNVVADPGEARPINNPAKIAELRSTRLSIVRAWDDQSAFISFDALQYIASYTDLLVTLGADVAAGERHYVQYGTNEGRSPDNFDEFQYLSNYPDLQLAYNIDGQAATLHYIQHGFAEGRTDLPY